MPQTTYRDIIKLNYNLAPRQLNVLAIPNKNTLLVRDLLDRKLKFSDRGLEVGSVNYISKSTHYFIRTKALQPEYFLPTFNAETVIPIRPQVFKNLKLKEGDVLISKDSNIGESVILDQDYDNYMVSGAIYKLPITKHKLYLLSFLKHNYFRKQLDLLVPKGSTIRHAKTLFLDCKIPFPAQKNSVDVVNYVELLTQSIIHKEKEIREKNKKIFKLIEEEILENQSANKFTYKHPNLKNIKELNRIDAGIYSEYFCKKDFAIKNYKQGYSSIKKLGFDVSRGQNLQISCIGQSISSQDYKENFYKVVKPMHISIYGTAFSQEYLGNCKKLKTLKSGDIIFGAEGFQKGRSVVILEDEDNTITNIHGITINHSENNILLSIFVKCFLDYLRTEGLIDLFAVGGNGGSLAMKYWDSIPIPIFPTPKQEEIAKLYHQIIDYPKKLNSNNFIDENEKWDSKSGIIELDKSIKKIKDHLNLTLDKIINKENININFDLLNSPNKNISV